MTQVKSFKIVGGPNKWSLFIDALVEGKDVQLKCVWENEFYSYDEFYIDVAIIGVERDQRKHHDHEQIIWGRLSPEVGIRRGDGLGKIFTQDELSGPTYFYARYSVHERKGLIFIKLYPDNYENNPFSDELLFAPWWK